MLFSFFQGKNDGSVSGVSYFKCAPLHGVFSKAERLTKLSGPERRTSVERTPRKPSAVQDTARFTSSKIPTLSPAGSSHALNRTPSPTGSMTSVASSVVAGPLKVSLLKLKKNTTTTTVKRISCELKFLDNKFRARKFHDKNFK